MKRLKILILVFCAALSIPLAYFVWQTYRGLAQEEVATLRFFANTLLDEIEQTLEALVQREEARVIDEYNFLMSPPGNDLEESDARRSPLSRLPAENYILGYFQNNPDGSFQTPLTPTEQAAAADRKHAVKQLERANRKFNRIRTAVTDTTTPARQRETLSADQTEGDAFAGKYLDLTRSKRPKAALGQKEKRFEEITVAQAKNVARQGSAETAQSLESQILKESKQRYSRRPAAQEPMAEGGLAGRSVDKMQSGLTASEPDAAGQAKPDQQDTESYQVEVAPLQSVLIDNDQIFIFRRILINQKIYRQGFILKVRTFLNHLAQNYFNTQPMANFANLRLQVTDQGRQIQLAEAGVSIEDPTFFLQRIFPSPFAFLSATLSCDEIPRSAGRQTLIIMMGVLAAVFLIGLFAIYKSAQTLVDLSERRSQFVSSVTHELKTPLTNIRM
ncbi:MAG: hypothetical protein PVI00_05765 [Desulfobacterales bacterium]|jgi:hypothetical protein